MEQVYALFQKILWDAGDGSVMRGADDHMRTGAADDHAVYHKCGNPGSCGIDDRDGGKAWRDLSGAADRGLHRRLLYGKRGSCDGGEDRDGYAAGRLQPSAAAFEYLL